MKPIIRWTIGPASKLGFLSLRLSVFLAKKIFADKFDYAICYNNLEEKEILNFPDVDIIIDQKKYIGIYGDLEPCGPAWKLYPARLRMSSHEICMDNDFLLYCKPKEIDKFINEKRFVITQAHTRSYHGVLKNFIDNNFNINSGFVCLPPEYDYQSEIKKTIEEFGIKWENHFSEQTLVAYIFSNKKPIILNIKKISVCVDELKFGSCGMHLVGLNKDKSSFGKTILGSQLIL